MARCLRCAICVTNINRNANIVVIVVALVEALGKQACGLPAVPAVPQDSAELAVQLPHPAALLGSGGRRECE